MWEDDGGATLLQKESLLIHLWCAHYVADPPVVKMYEPGAQEITGGRDKLIMLAKQFANSKLEDLFAATPPVETLRAIISDVATGEGRTS